MKTHIDAFGLLPANVQGILLATFGFAIFSINDTAGKFLMSRFGAFDLSFWIGIFSVISLIAMAPWLGGFQATFKSAHMKWHLLRSLFTALVPVFVLYALAHMPLVNFYTLVFLAPFITALLAAVLFKESIPTFRWVLIAAGFASVLIGTRPDMNGFGLPELAVIAVAILFSLRNLIVMKMGKNETLLSYGLLPYAAVTLVSLAGAIIDDSGLQIPGFYDSVLLIAIGVTSGISFVALSYAFKIADASAVAPTHYTQMVWGVILGYLIFGDIPDTWSATGAALVCVFGVMLVMAEKRYRVRV